VHDDDLKRIAGLDLCIEETDYDTLRALRFKDVYGDSEEINMYLPSLDEYLAICIKYDKQAVLELKNKMEPQQVLGIAKAVEDSGWFDRTTFISFSGENLLALREGYPHANAQFLVEDATEEEIQFMIDHHLDADVYWVSVTKDLVERLHNEGLKVNCWTVDEKEDARMLKKCGVDYITSNILE
jgi:glycerophosphoryl diester phosphodiesterase